MINAVVGKESNRIRQKNLFRHSVHERKLCTVNRNVVATDKNTVVGKESIKIRQKNPFRHSLHKRKLCTVNKNVVERGQKWCALTESAIESATTILLALYNEDSIAYGLWDLWRGESHERKLCTVNRNVVERGQKYCALTESARELATAIQLALYNVYMEQNSDRIANRNDVLRR
ncbi:hypothetical protein ACLOJK_039196 [Asimina triloba]